MRPVNKRFFFKKIIAPKTMTPTPRVVESICFLKTTGNPPKDRLEQELVLCRRGKWAPWMPIFRCRDDETRVRIDYSIVPLLFAPPNKSRKCHLQISSSRYCCRQEVCCAVLSICAAHCAVLKQLSSSKQASI